MAEPSFGDLWARFLDRHSARNERLIQLWANCRREMEDILEAQYRRVEIPSAASVESFDLLSFRQARKEIAQRLLYEPLVQWEHDQPYSRALAAIEDFDRSLEKSVQTLPSDLPVHGPVMLKALGMNCPAGFRRRLGSIRRKQFSLPFRTVIARELRKSCAQRFRTDGEFLLAFASATRHLKSHWDIARGAMDASILGRRPRDADLQSCHSEVYGAVQMSVKQADTALEGWRKWTQLTIRRLAKGLVASILWHPRGKPLKLSDQSVHHLDLWTEQMRSADAEIQLELALARSEDRILDLCNQALENLEAELANLMKDLEGILDWLRQWTPQNMQEHFPRLKADVVPADTRLAELDSACQTVLETLPESTQKLTRLSAVSRRRKRWKRYHPRATFQRAFRQSARQEIARLFEEIASEHLKIFQGIERARQVVGFAAERISAEENPESQVAQEALRNALSLLEFYRDEPPQWNRSASLRLARAVASIFIDNRLVLVRHRLGVQAYLAQQGLRRALVLIGQSTMSWLGQELRRLWQAQGRIVQGFLIYIGWKRALSQGKVQVITRPYLPEEFIAADTSELSALYRYLFRAEAVQDPRFLVGRGEEMSAIAQARALWEEGRPAALLIVGERGSGKTSLINCALKRWLNDLKIISGEFGERLVSPIRLRDFLARLVGVEDPAKLVRVLAEGRRVIILEEVERTFLRQVGYYEAIRELQRCIAATCSSTLWILSVNRVAFQFLDAAISLGQSFSHRINAGTASREDLQRAIMLRHNLSGLRAQFPAFQPPATLRGRLSNSVQGRPNPEVAFFNSLALESAGIYRAAFDLWLGQIESVRGGALFLNPIAERDLSEVTKNLSLDHLFALTAILQHGSLTSEEYGLVFQRSVAASQACLDELLTRELIQPDPGRPGFRVRPEAMPVVKDALYRNNLL